MSWRRRSPDEITIYKRWWTERHRRVNFPFLRTFQWQARNYHHWISMLSIISEFSFPLNWIKNLHHWNNCARFCRCGFIKKNFYRKFSSFYCRLSFFIFLSFIMMQCSLSLMKKTLKRNRGGKLIKYCRKENFSAKIF